MTCLLRTAVAVLALVAASPSAALAQEAAPSATADHAPGYVVPRTAFGAPDLQGVWSNASLTGLTRPPGVSALVLSPAEAAAAAERNPLNVRQKTDDNLDAGTSFDGKDLASGRGYNAFWISPGDSFGLVRGEFRTSWITDPPDGQLPISEAGRRTLAAKRATRGTGFDNPEERSLGERCIISFAGHAGPVMTNSRYYNDNFRIAQSPDHVVILLEMNHDARIIPLGGRHRPAALQPYMGDSVGRWEGDTLVVETINFQPEQGLMGRVPIGPRGRLVERFSRWDDTQILYRFTVEDPDFYTRSWSGEMSLNRSKDDVYEYACHEGNYAMHGILSGGRENDRKGVSQAPPEFDE